MKRGVEAARLRRLAADWLGLFRPLPGDNNFIGADGALYDLPTAISLSDLERRLEIACILRAARRNLCFVGVLHVDAINRVLDVREAAAKLDNLSHVGCRKVSRVRALQDNSGKRVRRDLE